MILFVKFLINLKIPMSSNKVELVQCFGKKRSAVAVATVRHGKGLLKVNGCPLETIQP